MATAHINAVAAHAFIRFRRPTALTFTAAATVGTALFAAAHRAVKLFIRGKQWRITLGDTAQCRSNRHWICVCFFLILFNQSIKTVKVLTYVLGDTLLKTLFAHCINTCGIWHGHLFYFLACNAFDA